MQYPFFLAFFLLFSACSFKNYEHTQSKIVIIKSPKLKFADLAYIRGDSNSVELELFVAGKSVKKIEIAYLVCTDEGCMSKSSFNESYLSKYYPDNLLKNILLAKPIYNGQELQRTLDGFTQSIQNKNVSILYTKSAKMVYFKDRKNHILFKIKETK
jgi:hypothetical protein